MTDTEYLVPVIDADTEVILSSVDLTVPFTVTGVPCFNLAGTAIDPSNDNTDTAFTVTFTDAVLAPSLVFTVTVAVPAALPDTTPDDDTVATFVFDDTHDTDLFDAFDGNTVTVKVTVAPTVRLTDDGLTDTPVTATVTGDTVTTVDAVLAPSAVFTVTVTVPTALPDTTPELLTDAIDVSDDDHDTPLFVASEGAIVGFNVVVPPTTTDADAGNDTPDTATVTVTFTDAVLAPSLVFTVTVAVPPAFPVTTPDALTDATDVSDDDHDTALFVAFDGDTVAVNDAVPPGTKLTDDGETDTPDTATGTTVTFVAAVLPPSVVLAVTVVVPNAFPDTTPDDDTAPTDVSDELHDTDGSVAHAGNTVITTCPLDPTVTCCVAAPAVNDTTGTFTYSADAYPTDVFAVDTSNQPSDV